ncbi:MAG: hypothetical protein JO197_01620 [Acidobacteria bacterium]|nr:hypothetical protein [Acidobacteriota bacterium]MBV9478861.1 hypothetical protein [Acidobacteriota bacterium]
MRKWRERLRSPLLLFFGTMLVGMSIATLLYRCADAGLLTKPGAVARSYTGNATDVQKLYLESRNSTSELLFKIAFTAFGALVAFVLSGARRAASVERGIFSAAGLLLSAMYAAFLYQIGASRCMEASLDDMFGPILNYPILCQFWFLFVAVMVIAVALFRGPRRAAVAAAIIITLVVPRVASAQTSVGCVRDWAKSRSVELPSSAQADAIALVNRMAARQRVEVPKGDRCELAETLLDTVRYSTIHDGQPASGAAGGAALAAVLHTARVSAESPNLSPGALMTDLVSVAEFWKTPSGIIDIDARKPLFITITDRGPRSRGTQWLRYTRCVLRLPPGHYGIRAADGTRIVYSAEIDLARDARIPIDVPKP